MPISDRAVDIFSSLKQWIEPSFEAIGRRLDELDARLKAIPAGAKGDTGADGAPGKDGADGSSGEPGPQGEPGKDGAPGMQGEAGPAGAPGQDGKDGAPGAPGRDGLPGQPGIAGRAGADGAPGRDGADGKDGAPGRDGGSVEDFAIEINGRVLGIAMQIGGQPVMRTVKLDFPLVRGIWKPGRYDKGDIVTYQGSAFIALCDTSAKPETADWRLMVKRGRDGKDYEPEPEQ